MDITLERIFSLVERKPDGRYVHGAKKHFCESIGAPPNIMSEWERGKNHSYRNYLYQISAVYNVSVEWLKGETNDKTKKAAPSDGDGLDVDSIIDGITDKAVLWEIIEKASQKLRESDK